MMQKRVFMLLTLVVLKLTALRKLLQGPVFKTIVSASAQLYGNFPGTAMNETLAIGNGDMGSLIFGETAKDRLVLNEIRMWTGSEKSEGSYQTLGNLQLLLSFILP